MKETKKTKKELWNALSNYDFADIVPRPVWDRLVAALGGENTALTAFVKKIAEKNNWTMTFAQEAVDEYKKFVYLAIVSDTDVTPSKVIDRVWHQHILFMKGYRLFCEKVLGGVYLDHNPALLQDESEMGVFGSQYESTLELYQREFGTEPPSLIWGVAKFKKEEAPKKRYEPYKKKRPDYDIGGDSDTPLYTLFPTDSAPSKHADVDTPSNFHSGGGHFGGGGAGSSWHHTETPSHHSHDTSPAVDSSPSCDSSPGASCSSSSSCGSSCGGGGD